MSGESPNIVDAAQLLFAKPEAVYRLARALGVELPERKAHESPGDWRARCAREVERAVVHDRGKIDP